jgi:hypothetical protein
LAAKRLELGEGNIQISVSIFEELTCAELSLLVLIFPKLG